MKKILIVEDDSVLREGIAYALAQGGFITLTAGAVKEAESLMERQPDLILLDINLPDGDGRNFLKKIRSGNQLPVLLLTARGGEADIVSGFENGCDDYITKPFSMSVLIKRLEAVLRRTGGGGLYDGGKLKYHYGQKRLEREGSPVGLTATETRLLELFLANRNQVLTREQILERIWDERGNFVGEKTLNVNIRRLREKIEENPSEPVYLRTIFGIGYKWSDDDAK